MWKFEFEMAESLLSILIITILLLIVIGVVGAILFGGKS